MIETTPLADSQNNDRDTSPSPSSPQPNSKEKSPARRKRPRGLRRSVWLDSWLFEYITLAFSVACFIVISITLYIYDGKLRPEMAYGLSLNTIVSVLATGCKSALILAVAEAISQLKWLWYQDPQQSDSQLVNMQRFDAASRGPLGSLMIIINHRALSLVSLGAGVIVLLLAFDPFIQQIISYPIQPSLNTNSTVSAFAPQQTGYFSGSSSSDAMWNNALGQALWGNGDFLVPPHCSSGDCKWDTFSSIGICSQCRNVTSAAKIDCDLPTLKDMETFDTRYCNITLPDDDEGEKFPYIAVFKIEGENTTFKSYYPGRPWYADQESPWITGGGEKILRFPTKVFSLLGNWYNKISFDKASTLDNLSWAGVKGPMWPFAYAELSMVDGSENETIDNLIGIENVRMCAVSLCLKVYNVSVTSGIPSVQTENVGFGTRYRTWTDRDGLYEPSCWKPEEATGDNKDKRSQEKGNFSFCDETVYDFSTNCERYVPSPANAKYSFLNHTGDGKKWVLSTDWQKEEDSSSDPDRTDDPLLSQWISLGLEKALANIADSLTKKGLQDTKHGVNGTVYVDRVFVDVRWPWMILPALLVLSGVIFFLIAIRVAKISNTPLWKSSALVPYYHGIERTVDDFDEYPTTSSMEKKAEEEFVQFQRSRDDRRLVLRQQDI